jgi:hypothetical protein
MAKIDFELPKDLSKQHLMGGIFAESSTPNWGGGESYLEKKAIACSIVNMAYYAKKCPKWNKALGDGSILGAIKQALVAYNKDRWLKIMGADKLLSNDVLEGLEPGDFAHLKETVDVVNQIQIESAPLLFAPLAVFPVQFNKALNSPPSSRFTFACRIQSHSFYCFKAGRECE